MRFLIANDKFKGSLSALEAGRAIAAGLPEGAELDLCPIADGGEGFTETLVAALGGTWVEADVHDALHRPVRARYGLSQNGVAIMEMAAASGLEAIPPAERSVLRSSTFGTGELLAHAASQPSVTQILIGLGGSATNDAGAGMADALGIHPISHGGERLSPWPAALADVAEFQGAAPAGLPPIEAACDVTNPLLGPRGATAVFAAQKGATPAERAELERTLERLVRAVGGEQDALREGAGAAGGLGFGLMHFLGARLRSGFDLVATAVSLEDRIEAADVVVTGEGSLDAQSLQGKGPIGVARLARRLDRPVWALAGHISPEVHSSGLFQRSASLSSSGLPQRDLMDQARRLLRESTARLCLP